MPEVLVRPARDGYLIAVEPSGRLIHGINLAAGFGISVQPDQIYVQCIEGADAESVSLLAHLAGSPIDDVAEFDDGWDVRLNGIWRASGPTVVASADGTTLCPLLDEPGVFGFLILARLRDPEYARPADSSEEHWLLLWHLDEQRGWDPGAGRDTDLSASDAAGALTRLTEHEDPICQAPGSAEARVLADWIVDTDYSQLNIVWPPDEDDPEPDEAFAGQVNGWAGAADSDGLCLILGRRSGGSHVRITLEPDEPPLPGEEWEDIVEVSVDVPQQREVWWHSWARETMGQLDLPAASYRVRLSARGRDEGEQSEDSGELVDHYIIEFWPAAPLEDAIIRVGSENARMWHREWGGRRRK